MFNHVELPFTHEMPAAIKNGMRWYDTPDGKKYPSVTTVVGYGEKPWLKEWQNMLGPQKAKKETQRCCDRGENVHKMVEMYLDNEEDPTREFPQEHRKLFNQLKVRLKKVDNIYAQELPLYSHRLKMAGRVDCIAEYDGKLAIIDFKTANNNKDVSKIQEYFWQTTAYAIMFHEMYGIGIENIVILMAVERGIMPLIFQDKIDKYVKPLLEKQREFYAAVGVPE